MEYDWYFNSRTAWGSSTEAKYSDTYRGVFQFPYCVGKFNQNTGRTRTYSTYFNSRTAWGSSTEKSFKKCKGETFQFPYCVGKFNLKKTISGLKSSYFNSRTAWGSSTKYVLYVRCSDSISIPVLRGEVQQDGRRYTNFYKAFQFPYCVGKFNSSWISMAG